MAELSLVLHLELTFARTALVLCAIDEMIAKDTSALKITTQSEMIGELLNTMALRADCCLPNSYAKRQT